MKTPRIRIGRKGILNVHGWRSAFTQPSGKFYKRKASKRARQCKDLSDGTDYKKYYGWFEWD